MRAEVRTILDHVVNADKHHPAYRNNCFLVASAFIDTAIFDSKISFFLFDRSECTLNKHWFEI